MNETARERALNRAALAATGPPKKARSVKDDKPPLGREEYLAAAENGVPMPIRFVRSGDVIRLKIKRRGFGRAVVVVRVDMNSGRSQDGYKLLYTYFTDKGRSDLSQTIRLHLADADASFAVEGHTDLALPVPSEAFDTPIPTRTTNDASEEAKEDATMATVVTRSKAKAKAKAKPAKTAPAKSAGKPAAAKRSQADIDKLVPAFVRHLKGGGTMRQLKGEHGFSDDGPIRSALYRKGYDSKGQPHGEEAGSIDASKAAGKKAVVKLRSEGAGWYRLAFLTGLGEGEVKKLVTDAGGPTGRVYTQSEKPAKEKAEAQAATPSGRKVTRRATKADPSSKG